MTEYGCPICGAARKRLCKHRIKWYQNYEIMTKLEALGFGLFIGLLYYILLTK